ncbi:MAG: L-serine ammonia-lyase, iron-sulfur-dependent, subunit alpha, partial [Polyangia bacterium]|nr:L-serine ammonia-lyase, iron-sulfur-dependent, subunit alpha [Polyangia bacterium]
LAAEAARGRVPPWVRAADCSSQAGRLPSFTVESVQIRTVRSLYKNALAVGIPNTSGGSGIYLAAALGPHLDPSAGLNLLKAIDAEALEGAHQILGSGRLGIAVQEHDSQGLFVEAQVIGVFDGERHVGEALIQGEHDRVTRLRQDGQTLFDGAPRPGDEPTSTLLDALGACDLLELISLASALPPDGRAHALEGVAMNKAAAAAGLKDSLGLGVGARLEALMRRGVLSKDVANRASVLAAAGTDARMSGHDVEVMSSSGSGNQGIMCVLPVAVVAEAEGVGEERLAEAVALAHLVTGLMTRHTGLLSALCGCVVKAGLGAAAGCAHVLGLGPERVFDALRNMAGNMTGEICDGAKVGCAIKLATAARAAVVSAYLAEEGVSIPASNGILASTPARLFSNIGEVAHSMREMDRTIVSIMEKKQVREPAV